MSDDEEQFNPKSHKQLLQAISSLGKSQHIRKTTRDEPKLVQDEFQLVKGAAVVAEEKAHSVGVHDIVNILKGTKKHLDAGKQLKNVIASKKVLEKPLEKPAAERIKRTIGYENVKKKLSKWDAVVAKNRSAETQVFPLKSETIYVNTSLHRKQPLQQSIKSELMLQMEELENKYAELKRKQMGDTDDPKELAKREEQLLKKKLTKDELIARRKELAYLKMRESQKSAKARMQNKIKSKKYHKLLKKQKMQEQIKEFELLQKTNPEAALEKLNALEKSRVLERANLRHKNTGTWAKNLQIRAKYDKDVRKDLAEQLQVSRQLTQKVKQDDSDDEQMLEASNAKEDLAEQQDDYDPFNPWTTVGKKHQETTKEQEDKANWRKYWLERNNNEKMLEEYKKLLQQEEKVEEMEKSENEEAEQTKPSEENMDVSNAQKAAIKKNKISKKTKKPSAVESKQAKSSKSATMENGWLVEELDPASFKSQSIDDIFDAKEDKIKEKLGKKLENLSRKGKQLAKSKTQVKRLKVNKKDALKNLKDLSFKNDLKRPLIDEELTNAENIDADVSSKKAENMAKLLSSTEAIAEPIEAKPVINQQPASDKIDPNQLACVKLKQNVKGFNAVNDEIGDVDFDDGDDAEQDMNEQQMTIAQAFEDDDIVADFTKDKAKDSEIKDAEIQLSMPGWGSWAGAGISKEQQERRNKRLLLKLAPKEKRKDENKGGLYINEEANKQLRNHLVSDIPFPFTSLSDYEASIRAPIGRNFVPETAFRLLTRPAVITQKGKIIEPMDESELLKPERKLRNPVDIRIAQMSKKMAKAK